MNSLECEQYAKKISDWIRSTLISAGFTNLIIGLSGGIDSSLAATLAVRAIGKSNIFPVLLPYSLNNSQSLKDAKSLIHNLKISDKQVSVINIKKTVDEILKETKGINDKIRRGNIMARVRMIYLFDVAKKKRGLVCGTENRTEYYLGYFTRFGDEASDLEPIRCLYKSQVQELAKYLNIPSQIIAKKPTADLWEGQTDEGEFGFSYKEADKILSYYFDDHLTKSEIIAKGIKKEIVESVLKYVSKNNFKHHVPKVFN